MQVPVASAPEDVRDLILRVATGMSDIQDARLLLPYLPYGTAELSQQLNRLDGQLVPIGDDTCPMTH